MKAPRLSVPLSCLAIASALILSSCASFGRQPTALTPRSESVCDQDPPSALPTIPETAPAIFGAFREVLALYHAEAIKDGFERNCRAKVRAENAKASGH